MVIKYTSHFLHKLEDLFAESDYMLRYEKGNFKSGYCVLKDTKMVLVNAYYPLEGKVNCIVDILRTVELSQAKFTDKSRKLLADILSQELSEVSNQLSIDRQGVVMEGDSV